MRQKGIPLLDTMDVIVKTIPAEPTIYPIPNAGGAIYPIIPHIPAGGAIYPIIPSIPSGTWDSIENVDRPYGKCSFC